MAFQISSKKIPKRRSQAIHGLNPLKKKLIKLTAFSIPLFNLNLSYSQESDLTDDFLCINATMDGVEMPLARAFFTTKPFYKRLHHPWNEANSSSFGKRLLGRMKYGINSSKYAGKDFETLLTGSINEDEQTTESRLESLQRFSHYGMPYEIKKLDCVSILRRALERFRFRELAIVNQQVPDLFSIFCQFDLCHQALKHLLVKSNRTAEDILWVAAILKDSRLIEWPDNHEEEIKTESTYIERLTKQEARRHAAEVKKLVEVFNNRVNQMHG